MAYVGFLSHFSPIHSTPNAWSFKVQTDEFYEGAVRVISDAITHVVKDVFEDAKEDGDEIEETEEKTDENGDRVELNKTLESRKEERHAFIGVEEQLQQ
jgi:hypothetical protein